MIAKETSGVFETAPAGTHAARCFALIDMGTQKDTFEGRTSVARKVSLRFELPMELQTTGEYAGQPFQLSKMFTLSLHKKAGLRAALESWRAKPFNEEELKGFDLRKILGATCMISVIHSDAGKANISTISAALKGMTIPTQINRTMYLELTTEDFSQQIYDELGKWTQDKIAESPEYKALKSGKPLAAEEESGSQWPTDDDIPF